MPRYASSWVRNSAWDSGRGADTLWSTQMLKLGINSMQMNPMNKLTAFIAVNLASILLLKLIGQIKSQRMFRKVRLLLMWHKISLIVSLMVLSIHKNEPAGLSLCFRTGIILEYKSSTRLVHTMALIWKFQFFRMISPFHNTKLSSDREAKKCYIQVPALLRRLNSTNSNQIKTLRNSR